MEIDSTFTWLFLSIFVVGFFALSIIEAGILLVRRERIQRLLAEQVNGSTDLESLHSTPVGPAGAVTLLKLICLGFGLVIFSVIIIEAWHDWGNLGYAICGASLILGILHLTARSIATINSEALALRVAPWVKKLARLLNPILALNDLVLLGNIRSANSTDTSGEDSHIELGISDKSHQWLDEREARMIRGVVRLDKTTAREIMLPRVDIVAAELGMPLPNLAEMLIESGHSRIPVYEDNLDIVKGIAYVHDVLRNLSIKSDASSNLTEDMIRPAMFIPETKNLEELLNEIQETRVHMAIVVDEYGGVSGLVTIEDLLEEIVGEINDEFDIGEPDLKRVDEREFLMDARTSIEDLNDLLNVGVESDGFDTVGGFVYHHLGKIPTSGDTFEYKDLRIEVVSTVGRRLKTLRFVRGKTSNNSSP